MLCVRTPIAKQKHSDRGEAAHKNVPQACVVISTDGRVGRNFVDYIRSDLHDNWHCDSNVSKSLTQSEERDDEFVVEWHSWGEDSCRDLLRQRLATLGMRIPLDLFHS